MIYLVTRMSLSKKARQDMKGFWDWLSRRDEFLYADLPMVEAVGWYLTTIGDIYGIENWATLADEYALADYRAKLSVLKVDDAWERDRVAQEEWWDFIDSRVVSDCPVEVGFKRS